MLIFYVIEGGRVVDPATKMHFDATLSQQQSESPHKKYILMLHCPNNKSESPHKKCICMPHCPNNKSESPNKKCICMLHCLNNSLNLPIKTEWNRCNGICLVFGPNILYSISKTNLDIRCRRDRLGFYAGK